MCYVVGVIRVVRIIGIVGMGGRCVLFISFGRSTLRPYNAELEQSQANIVGLMMNED